VATSDNLHSKFMEFMVEHNRPRMDGFRQWVLQPGMRFQAAEKWWGNRGRRPAPHEGLDLYSFEDAAGRRKTVDRHTQIPAAFAGHLVKIHGDFLGKSIFMSHEIFSVGGLRLVSAFGHTVPRDCLKIGQYVAAGEIIGDVAGGAAKPTDLPPHLHLTFAWVAADFSPAQLTWETLGSDPGIILIDPLPVILTRI
jgi:murein DD-endopeptidase MepM/ murein hydrolase activator NlpD